MPFAIAEAKEPSLEIHPADAAARSIRNGDTVRIFNDRGSLTARARVSDRARKGVVVALSVWWRKLTADRRNANELTAQALTDIGRGATLYDCLGDLALGEEAKVSSAPPIKPGNKDALIVVDVQNDFCPGGRVPGQKGAGVGPL